MSEYLRRLRKIQDDNPEQSTALSREKSCVVIAGPGSGKTFLLTVKVAKLLLEEVHSPRGVACFTYSRFMARQLKMQFQKLGVANNPRLFVGTLHGFCLAEIILPYRQLYADLLELPEPFRIASREERIEAIRLALLEQGQKGPQDWLKDRLRALDRYRRLHPYCDPHRLMNIEWSELASRFTSILLHGEKASADFVQLEVLAVRVVEQHAYVREALEARYPWWAIDEYQDLGYPMHRIVTAVLRYTRANVFAIGDPDQCIYEDLSGTSPAYFDELARQIEARDKSTPVVLLHNYRCANELIKVSEVVIGGPRGYQSDENGGICACIRCGSDNGAQLQFLLKTLLPKLKKEFQLRDLPLHWLAILHRHRRGRLGGLDDISNHLTEWPHSLDKDPDYDGVSEVIEWLEQSAKWCTGGDSRFDDLINFWIKLNTDVGAFQPHSSQFRLELRLFETLQQFRGTQVSLHEWFNSVAHQLDLRVLLNEYQNVQPDDVSEFYRLESALRSGGRLNKWKLAQFAKGPGRIQLTTLHSSKGTEFDTVIILGGESLSLDERRLAYVGITRAKKRVYLLYSGRSPYVEELRKLSLDGCHFMSATQTSAGL